MMRFAFLSSLNELLNDPLAFLESLLYRVPAMLIALVLHEWAHGFVAYKLGDPTPKIQGRVTVNPAAHIDIIGLAALMFIRRFFVAAFLSDAAHVGGGFAAGVAFPADEGDVAALLASPSRVLPIGAQSTDEIVGKVMVHAAAGGVPLFELEVVTASLRDARQLSFVLVSATDDCDPHVRSPVGPAGRANGVIQT